MGSAGYGRREGEGTGGYQVVCGHKVVLVVMLPPERLKEGGDLEGGQRRMEGWWDVEGGREERGKGPNTPAVTQKWLCLPLVSAALPQHL